MNLISYLDKAVSRFWPKVNKGSAPDACWIWTGAINKSGYGHFVVRIEGRPKWFKAHRISWMLFNRRTADPTLDICHRCDTPACVNPFHLWLGTRKDNMEDSAAKGRNGAHTHPETRPRGNKNGARLHPEKIRRGDAHPEAKLTAAQVLEIRRLYTTGSFTKKQLAKDFCVSDVLAGLIIRRKVWKHL